LPGQPVSRILSGGKPAWMDIYLGWQLPASSSGLPGDDWETGRSRLLRLLSCLTLHRMGVAWPGTLLNPPVVSYTTLSPLLSNQGERFPFCGPKPNVCTLPGVTRHAALWCADFPRALSARGHPANLVLFH